MLWKFLVYPLLRHAWLCVRYQVMVLELLHQSLKRHNNTNRSHFVEESLGCQYLEMHSPSVLDLTQRKEYASQAALWGIEVSIVLLLFIIEWICCVWFLDYKFLYILGIARPRWNISLRRCSRQIRFGWFRNWRMPSCSNACSLWTNFVGGTY